MKNMSDKIKWGIIGLGNIANKFAHDINLHSDSILYGVASRNIEKAENFKEKHNAVRAFGSYEELAKCADIDVIYIATPHVFHYENTMMCLREGKSVICEKPMSMNSRQSKEMIDLAKSKNLFLMEALWTRFIPATIKVLELIKNNEIGEIITIKSDFGFNAKSRTKNRLFENKLGGGSLLDIGIYPIFMSLILLGIPENFVASAIINDDNIDTNFNATFNYGNNVEAFLESTFEEQTPIETLIIGEKGIIKLHNPFHFSEKITLSRIGSPDEVFDLSYVGNGYYHEIEEVVNCLKSGKTESEKLPLSFSLSLISLLDEIRKDIGLKYESDN